MANESSVFPHRLRTTSESVPETTSPSSDSPAAPSSSTHGGSPSQSSTFRLLPLDQVEAHHDRNDRFALDAEQLRELADSLRAHGLINPISVAKHNDGYRLVAGYRRLEAARLIGWTRIPALILDTHKDADPGLRLAENLVRSALSPVEEARAIQKVAEQDDHTPEQIATRLNRSRDWVVHRMALANYPEEILDALHLRQIKLGVADELALVRDTLQRSALLRAAIDNGCTARTAGLWRAHANAYIGDTTTSPTQAPGPAVAGPPPTVHKQCFACDQPFDITTLSYLTVCSDCLRQLEQSHQPTPPAAPSPQPDRA